MGRAKLESLGFDRVWTEPATFPTWTREHERVAITSPVEQDLVALAIGFSPGTPEGGVEAEVAMFDDLAALQAAPADDVAGKIVFIRKRMERARDGSGYGPARSRAQPGFDGGGGKGCPGADHPLGRHVHQPIRAYRHHALRRRQPAHPGRGDLQPGCRPARTTDRARRAGAAEGRHRRPGQRAVHQPECHCRDHRKRIPEKIVALGAHLDSWDVGTGAIDDGAGVGIVTAAAKLIMEHAERPERSIRVILFAAEEIGLWGGRAWAEAHKDNIENYQLAAESDFGAGPVYEISARVSDEAWPVIEIIQTELEMLGIAMGGRSQARGGPDFMPMSIHGLAAADLSQDGTKYFDYHHTENDTLDKIDPAEMAQNVAAYAVLAWLAAQSPVDFGSGPGLLKTAEK